MSQPAIQRAGEGGGALPKGLSLFRFILFSCVMLGAIYGGASLYYNAPPMPGDVPPDGIPSAKWEPSAVWLPSFALMKFSIFVSRAADGYRFSSQLGHALFASVSIFLGMILGFIFGWFVGESVRKWWLVNRGY